MIGIYLPTGEVYEFEDEELSMPYGVPRKYESAWVWADDEQEIDCVIKEIEWCLDIQSGELKPMNIYFGYKESSAQ